MHKTLEMMPLKQQQKQLEEQIGMEQMRSKFPNKMSEQP